MEEIIEVGEEGCGRDMVVKIKWKRKKTLCVPLKQLKGVGIDDTTKQALKDWVYWNSQGYYF